MNMTAITTSASVIKPVTLPLFNLSCSADAQVVERVFKREPGVVKVYANPATEKVYIEYEVPLTNPDRLRNILQEAGFGPKTMQVSCRHCR
jgi:cation transport ATPase